MKRIMAIDYGDARTGVAISDATGMLAGFTTVIRGRDSQRVLEEIEELIAAHGVDELVMGFPRNMDGTEGPRAQLYRDFAAQLKERCGMPVSLWDERRTTIEAHQILHASGKRMKNHKKNVDAVAATLILEGEKLIHSGASTAGSRTAGRRGCAVQAFCTAKPWRKGGFISPAQVKMRGPRKIHDFVGRTRWRPR